MQATHAFWRSKFRVRIKKTRPTKTGTLRISHTSSFHCLIGEGADKRRSFENAKFQSKLLTSTRFSDLKHPRSCSCSQCGPEVLLLFVSVSGIRA